MLEEIEMKASVCRAHLVQSLTRPDCILDNTQSMVVCRWLSHCQRFPLCSCRKTMRSAMLSGPTLSSTYLESEAWHADSCRRDPLEPESSQCVLEQKCPCKRFALNVQKGWCKSTEVVFICLAAWPCLYIKLNNFSTWLFKTQRPMLQYVVMLLQHVGCT